MGAVDPALVNTSDVRVDGDRVIARLDALAAIGRDPRGGLSRFAYTPEHAEACGLVAGWMREAGLDPFLDGVGNLIGASPGDGSSIAAGSHLDTVPMGGRLDGALGVVGAVECAQALRDAGVALGHRFAALAFADEEGNTFGIGCLTSRALIGGLPPERMRTITHRDGRSLADCVATWDCPLPAREPPALAAYLELHIEQGPRLESEAADLAAATAIAGIGRTTVTFEGQANHGGTTPMALRRDALWGASALVLEIRRLAMESNGEAVATVGRLEVEPGGTNVVPGLARLRVEVRSGDEHRLDALRAAVDATARTAAQAYGLRVTIDPWDQMPAQPLDERVTTAIVDAAEARRLRIVRMPSWAGHDAKILAPHLPAGLLFVPSIGGVSHAPGEATAPEHLAGGAQVLLDTVRLLDARLDHA
jgi:hydantoinase/carbamoylase family amidase